MFVWIVQGQELRRVTVPDYKSIDVNLLARILRNAEITEEEFLKILRR